MKLLILFLISFSAFAEFEVVVKRNNLETHRMVFSTEAKADAWIELHNHDKGAFGPLGEFTTAKTDITAQVQEEARLANVLAVGEKITDLCNSLSKMVVGYNYTRSLTALQIEEMTTTFSPIVTLVEGKRPFSAKPLIEAITPDGVVITEQMKSDLLNEYSKRGF